MFRQQYNPEPPWNALAVAKIMGPHTSCWQIFDLCIHIYTLRGTELYMYCVERAAVCQYIGRLVSAAEL